MASADCVFCAIIAGDAPAVRIYEDDDYLAILDIRPIVRGHTLLADAVASSVDEQARFGGVVPEVASRAHLEAMSATVQRALRRSIGGGANH